jgi:DNA mismatch endonuclease (patch repair protein)
MADIVDPATRSRMMAGIRGKNTLPEMRIRRGLHRRGFRYRLHSKSLPGKPDLVFPSRHAVIMVHGCFWHGHGCSLFKWPSSRIDFWHQKINRNREKDTENEFALAAERWRVLTIWECALKGRNRLLEDDVLEAATTWLREGTGNMSIQGINNVID